MYLLDTDIAIFAIRGNKTVLQRLGNLLSGQWAISTITAFEIQKGLEAHPNTRSSAKAQLFLANVEPLMFDAGAAAQAAKVFHALKQMGRHRRCLPRHGRRRGKNRHPNSRVYDRHVREVGKAVLDA